MTPKKLNQQLKQTFSKTFKMILNEFRVRMAEVLLLNTKESMQKIANQVGFEDIDTFARNFKKVYWHSSFEVATRAKKNRAQ